MGFTIGGLREIRELRGAGRRPARHGRVPGGTAVATYTGLWGWDVVPGACARRAPAHGGVSCSCGLATCAAPGAHPLVPGLRIPAGTPLDVAMETWAAAWARGRGATVLLPTGLRFDVLEVPEAAGRRALLTLERLGLPLGPVALAPHGRAWFLVAPGAAAELPELLYRTGWDDTRLDLRGLGPGRHITAPPCDHGGRGQVGWLRPPEVETAAAPPPARLLLGALAYATARLAAGGRRVGRRGG